MLNFDKETFLNDVKAGLSNNELLLKYPGQGVWRYYMSARRKYFPNPNKVKYAKKN